MQRLWQNRKVLKNERETGQKNERYGTVQKVVRFEKYGAR
jgi:hypothetical protein